MEQNIYTNAKRSFQRSLFPNLVLIPIKKRANVLIIAILLLLSGTVSAQVTPTIIDLLLRARSDDNLTTDSLYTEFWYTIGSVETASAWYKNGVPEATMLLPFEAGQDNALLDFSGNSNNASFSGVTNRRPSFMATDGYNGTGVYEFDGNDYLSVGDIMPTSSSYTKTAWIYLSSSGGTYNIISSVENDDNNHFLQIDPSGTLTAGHSFEVPIVDAGDALVLDVWYFVAVTFDYASGEMILYTNGFPVDAATVPSADLDIDYPSVLIGAMDYDDEWDGRIDEPVIYDHVLTPEQIYSLSTAGNSVIVAEETEGLDEWYAVVTPFSATQVGTTDITNTITVTSILIDLPDQTISEGAGFGSIDLDNYVVDYEYPNSSLVWSFSGNSQLAVAIDAGTHVLTVTPPDADWFGSEDISLVATNPKTDADTLVVAFTIESVNDAPVIAEVGPQSVNEDNSITGLEVNFTDAESGDTHSISVTSDNTNVTVSGLVGSISGSTYNLVPAANWSGTADITVVVTDDAAVPLSDTEIYTLTVANVNDAPILTEIADQTTTEEVSITGLSVDFSDVDDSDTHVITVVSDELNVTVENLSGNDTGSTYDLVPAADWDGTAEITVMVVDNGTTPLSDSYTYTLTIEGVNDAPVLTEIDNQSTTEGTTLVGLVVDFSDADDLDTHVITVVSDELNVTVANLNGNDSGSTYDLVPAADWNGTAQITVTVTDDGTGPMNDSETYTLTVSNVNDTPALTDIGSQSTDEDAALTGLVVDFTDIDGDDAHTITVTSNESNVTVANLSGNVTGSTYDLVPAADWNGIAQITVTVTDNGVGALNDSEIYTLTVDPVNDAPTAVDISNNSTEENVPVGTVIGLLSSTDVDAGDTHVYTFVSDGGFLSGDNDAFIIVGDTLKTNAEINYEEGDVMWILVQSDDGDGGLVSQNLTIYVTDLLETGVREFENDLSLRVYPVPAVEFVTVEVDNPDNKDLLLEIFSDAGKLVHSERTIIGNTIYLNEFSDGMYILRVSGENVFQTRKIVLNR